MRAVVDEGGGEVHRDDLALLVEEADAVGVAVEGNAEGVLAGVVAEKLLDVGERLGVEGIGVVVGEVAVVVAVERVVGEGRAGERGGFGDAHAVREVHRDVEGAGEVGEGARVGGVLL